MLKVHRPWLGLVIPRNVSGAPAGATNSKELLMKLRRKTNYSFANCRRALEKHQYDLDKAARWLEETAVQEGWQKAAKLAGRAARQGLIGVGLSGRLGAIVEVNCETDFVARTSKFRHLVSAITGACCEHAAVGAQPVHSDGQFSKQIRLPVESVTDVQVRLEDKTCSIADALALSVASFGERISFSRCALLSVAEGSHVSGYVHPKQSDADGDVRVGNYGALVAFGIAASESAALIGQQLCQHIVGMNPKSLGKPMEAPEEAAVPLAAGEDAEDDDESGRTVLNDSTELLRQSFLLNPDMLVQQFLEQNDVVVLDFIRFALGEEIN